MLRSMLQRITDEFQKKHEKPGIKQNEDLVQIKVIMTSHGFSPDYTLHQPKLHGSPQVNIHSICRIENIFTVQDFEQFALAFKNRVFPQNFHCVEYISYHSRFFSNFALTLKNRVCPEIFHCIQYTVLFTFRIFEQLALALNSLY